MEESPVEDSHSNGFIERAIQEVQGQIRATKSALEARLGQKITSSHPGLPWLVMHAANTLNRYAMGQDGRTAYHRLSGKKFNQEVVEFGEEVWYMHPGITGKHKLDNRWSSGVWLGMRERTNESIIGTSEGCLKARSIKRRPEALRWEKTQWDNLQGVPWEPVPGREGVQL